ncbi:MAG: hypothetical protein ACI35S_00770 [Anaeroplasma sp.]
MATKTITTTLSNKVNKDKVASSSDLGLVKSVSTGTTANRDYNVEVNSDGTMKVNVPWENTVYTHPTSSGNKHIPSGGSSGQVLRWSSDGTAAWANISSGTKSDNSTSITSILNGSNVELGASGVTAGSYGDSSAQTPSYGSTFKVPYVTVNEKGIVTGISEHTVKIPSSDNTNTAHSHSAGVGLTGSGTAGTSGTYTYKVNLVNETNSGEDSTYYNDTQLTSGTKLYAVQLDKSNKLAVRVPYATTAIPGLMSVDDKNKLDSLSSGAISNVDVTISSQLSDSLDLSSYISNINSALYSGTTLRDSIKINFTCNYQTGLGSNKKDNTEIITINFDCESSLKMTKSEGITVSEPSNTILLIGNYADDSGIYKVYLHFTRSSDGSTLTHNATKVETIATISA